MVYINRSVKFLTILFLALLGANFVSAASPLLDVTFSEYIYEEVLYNPLEAGGGTFYDANENQTTYTITGQIVVENVHGTQAAENVVLNITNIAGTSEVAFSSGSKGYITERVNASDYMILSIPDLAPGANTTFIYTVNATNVTLPINFTTSYGMSRVFAGRSIDITDTIQNNLNSTLYTDSCIYDINITQVALQANASGTFLNFTYNASTISGTDSTNVTFAADNRTLFWNVQAGNCMNSGNQTDISYDLITPAGIAISDYYKFINATIAYTTNNTYSRINLESVQSLIDMELNFEKYMDELLADDNATWRVNSQVSNPTNIDVNLTQVSLWVSVRDGTGTGFTDPSILDNDTVDGSSLTLTYNPNILLNSSITDWNNTPPGWQFNYTFSASPIVWMNLDHEVINDGLQLTNKSISYADDTLYVKEIYIATGYWLQITKNITRLADDNFTVFIEVTNLGTSPTPADQVVQVYNFLPNTFNLTSIFAYSSSTWYTTQEANETLNDPIYNGTMYQFAIMPNGNQYNSSLDKFGAGSNTNNTWSVTYNVTGSGEFDYEDLFLTGVDPLSVEEKGSTLAVIIEGTYSVISAGFEYVLGGAAIVIGALVLLL